MKTRKRKKKEKKRKKKIRGKVRGKEGEGNSSEKKNKIPRKKIRKMAIGQRKKPCWIFWKGKKKVQTIKAYRKVRLRSQKPW